MKAKGKTKRRTVWQEIRLFWQFASGTHWIYQERTVLI
jgi:hypothetical protein